MAEWISVPIYGLWTNAVRQSLPFEDGIELIEESGLRFLDSLNKQRIPTDQIETRSLKISYFSLRIPVGRGDFNSRIRDRLRQIDFLTISLLLSKKARFHRKYAFVYKTTLSGDYEMDESTPIIFYSNDTHFPSSYTSNEFDASDFKNAKETYPTIKKHYDKEKSRFGSALQWFWSSNHTRWTSHRILAQWAGLESLFGGDTEISHKLSERIACFLEETSEKRFALFSQVKAAYNVRSKITHGATFFTLRSRNAEELGKDHDVLFLDDLLRRCLTKILIDTDWINIFDGNGREEVFTNLIFRLNP